MTDRRTKKIAVVTPIAPYPPDSGSRIRIYNLIRRMAEQGLKIFLLSFDSKHENGFPSPVKRQCEDAKIIKPQICVKRSSLFRRIMQKVCGMPFESRPSLSREIQLTLQEWMPDFIQIEKTISAAYLNIPALKANGIRLVLEEGGVHHVAYERQASLETSPFNKWIYRRRAKRLKLFEKNIIAQMDAVVAVSEKEANLLRSMNAHINILVAPNGVDEKIFQENVSPVAERELVAFFCGSLSYTPNRDAIEIYLRDIMPRLVARGIKINFVVAGGGIPESLAAEASKNPQFRLLGYVNSIEPYFKKFAIFVNPMRLGGGTRLKMLEAMAYGMSCVSTSVGAEGIPIHGGKQALIADTPEAFASHIEYLLCHPRRASELGQAARDFVGSRYLWPQCAEALISYYKSLNG